MKKEMKPGEMYNKGAKTMVKSIKKTGKSNKLAAKGKKRVSKKV